MLNFKSLTSSRSSLPLEPPDSYREALTGGIMEFPLVFPFLES